MTDKTLSLSGFSWVEHEHIYSNSSTEENPLYDSKMNDPDYLFNEQIQMLEQEIDDFSKDPSEILPAKGSAIHIGIDCEYERDGECDNAILSYQYCLYTPLGISKGIVYPKHKGKKSRISFNQFLGCIAQSAKSNNLIKTWPKIVYVYAHFMRADITHFKSFWQDKDKVDALRNTVASITKPLKADPLYLKDKHRHTHRTYVRFIDTMLITPGSQGLDAAGELIGIPKLDLPDGYSKADMGRLLKENQEAFEQYALRDAEITVQYGLRMRGFVNQELGLNRLPPTIGSIATTLFKSAYSKEQYMGSFGLIEYSKRTKYDEEKGRIVTKNLIEPDIYRDKNEAFVIKCYHGGRNECYQFGGTAIEEINDFDLRGAYTNALLDIRPLDYKAAYDCNEVEAFLDDVCGFAKVKFEFPPSTKYPCLPVIADAYGLYFPLSGDSFCTAPEIALAVNLGCTITIDLGVIVPWVEDKVNERIFEPFVKKVREQRTIHKSSGDKFSELLWKEIGNSLYGKTAQGLKDKSGFDTRTGGSKKTAYSQVTNPYFAAHVTGLVRAVVSELVAKIPVHRKVYSVTTDGFLTNASLDEIDCTGVLAKRFIALVNRLNDSSTGMPPKSVEVILERKHRIKQAFLMKTRGQGTCIPHPDESEIILAKANIKPPMKDKERA